MKNRDHLQEFRTRVSLYFDNELNADDERKLLNEVDHDSKCNKIFKKEKVFRDFIKNNVRRSSVSPDLVQSIKDQIRVV